MKLGLRRSGWKLLMLFRTRKKLKKQKMQLKQLMWKEWKMNPKRKSTKDKQTSLRLIHGNSKYKIRKSSHYIKVKLKNFKQILSTSSSQKHNLSLPKKTNSKQQFPNQSSKHKMSSTLSLNSTTIQKQVKKSKSPNLN